MKPTYTGSRVVTVASREAGSHRDSATQRRSPNDSRRRTPQAKTVGATIVKENVGANVEVIMTDESTIYPMGTEKDAWDVQTMNDQPFSRVCGWKRPYEHSGVGLLPAQAWHCWHVA